MTVRGHLYTLLSDREPFLSPLPDTRLGLQHEENLKTNDVSPTGFCLSKQACMHLPYRTPPKNAAILFTTTPPRLVALALPSDISNSPGSGLLGSLSLLLLIWKVVSCDGNDEVDEHAKCTFEVVGLAVTEEVADGEDGEDEEDDLEDGEVEILRSR